MVYMDTVTGSILDRVISSKKTTEIEHFHPSEVVSLIFKGLIQREEDVLRRRFALGNGPEETLEEIGVSYHVTRERIRQIETVAIKKLKKAKSFRENIRPVEDTISSVLEQHGGIMAEDSLLRHILQIAGDTVPNRHAVLFMLRELLNDTFKLIKESKQYRPAWYLRSLSLHLLEVTIQQLVNIITQIGHPAPLHTILEHARKIQFFQEHQTQLTDDTINAYLEVSQKIGKNPYGEFGLVEWGSITPKRMNDKIYLVLKKSGKPLHFTEITRMINEMGFDDRKAYPPTVHNELILNEQYVLIGRGIYALKEWGYHPGVVADVLTEILRSSTKPMNRNELVDAVLKQRVVKRNTVYLALTDKMRFTKNPDGTYSTVG